MMIDAELVEKVQTETKFRNDTVEQVLNMISVLKMIPEDPELRNSYVLIGGTAINLFGSKIPRLSVDLDFDYTHKDNAYFKPAIIKKHTAIIERISEELGMQFLRTTDISSNQLGIHLTFKSNYNPAGEGIVKLDISYLMRTTILRPIQRRLPELAPDADGGLPVLTAHPSELLAGKALALVYRTEKDPKPEAVRDMYSMFIARHLFDVSRIEKKLKKDEQIIDEEKLRTCFILKGVSRVKDFYFLRGSMLRHCGLSEVRRQLLPFLVQEGYQRNRKQLEPFLHDMKINSIDFLDRVCGNSWSNAQRGFVRAFQERKTYKPELLFGQDNPDYADLYENEYLKESAKEGTN